MRATDSTDVLGLPAIARRATHRVAPATLAVAGPGRKVPLVAVTGIAYEVGRHTLWHWHSRSPSRRSGSAES